VRVADRDSRPIEHAFKRPLPITGCVSIFDPPAQEKYLSLIFGTPASAVKTNSGSVR
jgi:hypothetical protein